MRTPSTLLLLASLSTTAVAGLIYPPEEAWRRGCFAAAAFEYEVQGS